MNKIATVTITIEDGTNIETLLQFKGFKKLERVLDKLLATGHIKSNGITFDPESVVMVHVMTEWVH